MTAHQTMAVREWIEDYCDAKIESIQLWEDLRVDGVWAVRTFIPTLDDEAIEWLVNIHEGPDSLEEVKFKTWPSHVLDDA